jgi:hypothetical protein
VKADTVFLTVSEVLGLHSDQIREFGGAAGIRDQGLLESAVAQASTTYDGEYLHNGLFEMSAAYALSRLSARRSTEVASSELDETRTSDPAVPSYKWDLVDDAGCRN